MRLFPLGESSSSGMENELSDRVKKNQASLFLNVYDLTPANDYLYWFGVGIFHSGIEVHGLEYGFGAHEYSSSGVFEVEPRSCPGFIFRRSVLLGTTDMSRSEFRSFMEQLSAKYHGDTYHLIAKNCNHFTDEVCNRLTGKPIPGWVNRLARLGYSSSLYRVYSIWHFPVEICYIGVSKGVSNIAAYASCPFKGIFWDFGQYMLGASFISLYMVEVSGSFCNCLLPENIQVTAVRHLPDHPTHSDDDGSESAASFASAETEDEEPNHHLLATTNGDVAFLKEKPVRLARELM